MATMASLGNDPHPVPSFTFPPTSDAPLAVPVAERRHRRGPSVNALPAFTFNPSNSQPPVASTGLATPPLSPDVTSFSTSPTAGSRGTGHRRAPSEFIGGDGIGGAGLMSTSPVKGDQLSLPIPAPKFGPPAGRRGHAHRRSGAISCHDMQSILQSRAPPMPHLSGSAPTSPFDQEGVQFFAPGHARRTTSDTSLPVFPGSVSAQDSTDDVEASPRRPPSRTRVGFSERVEYIRPLSIISSETESSISTIRGHSVTNSLSSITSGGSSSPFATRLNRPGSLSLVRSRGSDDFQDHLPRSSFRFGQPIQSPATPLASDNDRPLTATQVPRSTPVDIPSPTEPTQKRRSFGWWDSRKQTPSPKTSIPTSRSEPHLVPPTDDYSSVPVPAIPSDALEKGETSGQKKPRKVKSWTSSLRTKKSRTQSPQLQAVDAPKSPSEAPLDEPAIEEPVELDPDFIPDFDDDTTITIVSESTPAVAPASPSAGRKSKARRRFQEECASPVIDLDFALAPLSSPQSPRRGSDSRAGPRVRHSMYTMASTTQNHRRTESAPELAPFPLKKVQSPMEDVFEEEEEPEPVRTPGSGPLSPMSAEYLPSPPTSPLTDGAFPTPAQAVTTDNDTMQSRANSKSPTMQPVRFPHPRSRRRMSATPPAAPSPVEVVEPYEEPRATLNRKGSNTPMIESFNDKQQPSALTTLGLPSPTQMIMTPDTISGSSFSGRDFPTSSQISLDTPRLGTATSSGTDNRSIFFSEPGPEVRMSVDDVPSLTSRSSVRSGITGSGGPHHSASAGMLRPQSAFTTSDNDNTAVTFDFASGHPSNVARKRASMASLSRLMGVGGSFTGTMEKSKLSMESRPPSQHSTLTVNKDGKKGKRLSKLMGFFRPKGPSRVESS